MWGIGNAINFIKKGEGSNHPLHQLNCFQFFCNPITILKDNIIYQNSVKIHNSFLSL